MKLHKKCVKEKGKRACGRNIVRDGYGKRYKNPSSDRVVQGIRGLEQQLRPVVTHYQQSNQSAPPQSVSTGSGGCSGSSNPNVNPCGCEASSASSVSPDGKYRGKYQFDMPTWQAHGGVGDPAQASEQYQDEIASRVGYDAWPNC